MKKQKSWPYILLSIVFLIGAIVFMPGNNIRLPQTNSETKKPNSGWPDSFDKDTAYSDQFIKHEEESKTGQEAYIISEGLSFLWRDDTNSYAVNGLGSCTDSYICIPDRYEGFPVTRVSMSAFAGEEIKGVRIPDSVTHIDADAFAGCLELTSVSIGDGVEVIGGGAFMTCINLSEVLMGNSVTQICNQAFLECKRLTSIKLPDSLTTIDYAAFYGTGLYSIEIPASVTSLGEQMFNRSNDLRKLSISPKNPVYHSSGNCIIETASKTLIGGCATSVIPDDGSVTRIGDYVFWGCERLTEITIPRSVESIGEYAFRGCTMLELIRYNGTTMQWNAIKKGYNWDYESPIRFIECSDGALTHDM